MSQIKSSFVGRANRLVTVIDEHLDKEAFRPLLKATRVTSLPGMLRRHGLLLTVVFLRSKETCQKPDDGLLVNLLEIGIKALFHENDLSLNVAYLKQDFPLAKQLYLQDLAMETANWIQRLVAAREILEKVSSSVDEEGAQGEHH